MEELISEILKRKPNRLLLQLPEGLKARAIEIIEKIEQKNIEVFLSADPCYGACDLRVHEAEMLGCDIIVHIGHNKFYKNIKSRIPVLYYPWKIDIGSFDFSAIKEKKIGLITTIQHLHEMKKIAEQMKKQGKEPVIGGQILGCWTDNARKIEKKIDAFLFVGSGRFHSLALKEKPVYALDIEKNRIEKIDTALFEKKRFARIYKCREAKTFGILVSSKPGQMEIKKALAVKKSLERKDKKAFVLIMDEINDSKLFMFDAYVNTACPRLTDDSFSKPIINADDVNLL
ncbi:MAG TPA: diphthamide biosynthesis enzyme Dph2 [archaeon]|nr:diphthamide biosynthesis enzyme Dph2 [archaeon]